MDCDLQEPPELIPRLYAKAQEGYDIVHTTPAAGAASRAFAGRCRHAATCASATCLLETDAGTDHGTLSILSRARPWTRS